MQGWIVKPPGFDPAKKYPLVLEIHGGPFAMLRRALPAEIQLYASAGYVVLYMTRAQHGLWRGIAISFITLSLQGLRDLMSGVDAVAARLRRRHPTFVRHRRQRRRCGSPRGSSGTRIASSRRGRQTRDQLDQFSCWTPAI